MHFLLLLPQAVMCTLHGEKITIQHIKTCHIPRIRKTRRARREDDDDYGMKIIRYNISHIN